MRATERLASTPRDRLLAIFDAHGAWFHESSFSGCIYINAAAEFSSQDDPNHIACAEHKRLVRDYLRRLAEQAGARSPALAAQLNMLQEGAIVEAHVSGNRDAASLARAMAAVFVAQACD